MNRFDAIALIAAAGVGHWSYSGKNGPGSWGNLEPDFRTCSIEKQGSPVNLTSPVHAQIGTIEIAYKSAPLRIINNGHTIQCNQSAGSALTMRGRQYGLVQFHFHIPSEHEINGKRSAMELHLVHANVEKSVAVLGVMLDEGAANDAITQIWSHMPMHEGPEQRISGVQFNPVDLLPSTNPYFEYLGSLTTPPCTENVLWLVLATPQHLSREQIYKFHQAYAMNARPLQKLNQRLLLENG